MVSPQIDETEVQTLLERGIAALKTGDKSTAFKALTQLFSSILIMKVPGFGYQAFQC